MTALAWIESAGFMSGDFALRLTATLMHFLWQGLAVAVVVFLATQTMSQASARARYAASFAGLLLMAACVPVTFALMSRSHVETADADTIVPSPIQAARAEPSTTAVDNQWTAPLIVETDISAASFDNGPPQSASRERVPTTSTANVPESTQTRLLSQVAPLAAAVYLVGVAIMLARLAFAVCGGQRLRKSATPVCDPGILLIVRQQSRRIGLKVAPLVCYCERVAVPVVVGVLRPTILLPTSLVSGLTPDQIEALITHELSHIRRFDLVANLVQRLIESLLFFHPAVWYVSRRVSAERENCCDDLAVSAGCDRVQYAGTLIRVAEAYAAAANWYAPPHTTAIAATGTHESGFKRRIRRLLNAERPVRLTRGGATLAIVLLVALLMLPLAAPIRVGKLTADDEVHNTSEQLSDPAIGQTTETAAASAKSSPGTDLYHDPLPEGAILRLGTSRFQSRWRTGRIAFSPDGKLIAATGAYRSLRIWDLASGNRVTEIKDGTTAQQGTAIAFSHDGRYLAMGRDDGLVQVFSVPAGEEVFSQRQIGATRRVGAVAFSPTGVLASTGERGEVCLWDVATGDQLEVLIHVSDQGGRDMHLVFSPNGEMLASSCHNNVRIWRLGVEPACTYIAQAHEHEVSSLAFVRDGGSIVTAGHTFETAQTPPQSQLRVWDAETGQRRSELYEEVGAYFSGLAIRDNGQTLIVTTQSRVHAFDLESETLRRSLEINGPLTSASSEWVAVSPDGKTLAYTRWGSAIRLLDLTTEEPPLPERESHEAMIRATTYSPDGNRIATGSSDGTVRIWDATTGRQIHRFEFSPRCMNFFAVAFSPDGRFVAAAGDYNKEAHPRQVGLVKVWNALTGELWHEFQLEGTAYFNVAFSHDGSLLAAAPHPMRYLEPGQEQFAVQQSIDMFRMDNGRKLVSLAGHSSTSTAIAFTPNDNGLVSAGRDKTIKTWKLPSGELETTHSIEDASTAAFAPDAKIVSTSSGLPLYRVTTRDAATGEAIHNTQTKSGFGAHAMDISDDGKLLVTGCQEETIFVWDMATGRQLIEITSPDATVYALAFDPSGQRVVTGMDDGTALVWDVSAASNR